MNVGVAVPVMVAPGIIWLVLKIIKNGLRPRTQILTKTYFL